MAFSTSALVTFALPTTYADGTTSWPASNYASALIFRDGVKIGTVNAPALSYTDTNISAGSHTYTVEVIDGKTGLTSAPSMSAMYVQPAQLPGQPVIISIVASPPAPVITTIVAS